MEYETDPSKPLALDIGFELNGEEAGGRNYGGWAALAWRPGGRFNLLASVWHGVSNGWLLHQEDRNFTTFDAKDIYARLAMDFFPSARHQFRVALQWVGIEAEEKAFFLVPEAPGDLLPNTKPPGPADDFNVSSLNFQARYRWQIAPLSDLFVVYTRNANESPERGGFGNLFKEAWNNPSGDQLTVKLRYRLGS